MCRSEPRSEGPVEKIGADRRKEEAAKPMVKLQIGSCLNCPQKVGLHPKHPEWRHFGLGRGYLLSVNCSGYAGSTNTRLDLGAFRQGQFKCDCVRPDVDSSKPIDTKRVLI